MLKSKMTPFKFNFLGNNTNNEETADKNEKIKWFECEEIIPDKQINDLDEIVVHAKMFVCDEVEIGHVSSCDKLFSSCDHQFNAFELAEKEHSDLIAGKYEGGLKVWECTSDLIKYLLNNTDINFKGAKVLDLGCGVGILGIFALKNDSIVTFQDYNKEIIECVTIPSVLLNIAKEQRDVVIKECKFYSGDWASFDKILTDDVFDIILTSETIYNEKNYEKLRNVFLNRLSKDGCAYVAAKTCYFGVGGGMRQFETYIQRSGLISKVAWKSSGGIQREILKIKRI